MTERARTSSTRGGSRGSSRGPAQRPATDERNPPPEGESRGREQSRGQSPSSSRRQSQQDRAPWLKPEHFKGDYGMEYDIAVTDSVRLYTGGKFGDQIIIGVSHNDERFDWSIKIGGQQFLRLEKRLGKNLLEWRDRIVPVKIEVFNDNDYIAVIE